MSQQSPVLGDLGRTATATVLFLVHSNVYISLSATSIAAVTMVLLELPVDPLALFLVFAATMFVYSANKITDLEADERNVPGRAAFTRRYGTVILVLGTALYLAALALAVTLGVPGAPYMVVPLVVVVVYVKLKELFLVKNLLVGLAWGLIPLGVGVYYGQLSDPTLLFLSGYVTVMLTLAAIVFDIKDIPGDRAEGVRTVPVVFSPTVTRRVTQVLNLAVGAVVLGAVLVSSVPSRVLVLLAYNAYVACYIPFATRDRGPLFYGFVVDGEQIFLGLCVCLLSLVSA